MYTAYVLSQESREVLKKKFPPKFSTFVGHHITVQFGVPANTPLPPETQDIRVVGYSSKEDEIEALVVSIDGRKNRPDGKLYHITWSLNSDKGIKPVDSNGLLRLEKYTLIMPIKITATPELIS